MSERDTILTMESITKTFGPVKALTDVNLSVERGEIHAICGENGAGKSTLMNVLSGVYPYGSYGGRIMFDGKDVQFSSRFFHLEFHAVSISLRIDDIRLQMVVHQDLGGTAIIQIINQLFVISFYR